MCDFWKRLDWKIRPVTVLSIVVLLLIAPATLCLPQSFGYENSWIENFQMAALLITCVMALSVKHDKKFFIFVALVTFGIVLREVNYGRMLFFAIPGKENMFYRWEEIKYGYLAHPLVGLYIFGVLFFFAWNKLYLVAWRYLKKGIFPAWEFIFVALGIILGTFGEEVCHDMVFEEMGELLAYTAFMGLIYLYGFNRKFFLEEAKESKRAQD